MMKYIINADSIQNNLGSLLPSERMPEVEPLVNIASNVVMGKNVHTVELKLPENPAKPSWNKDYMTPSLAAECHKKLSEPNIILHLKCPVYVKGKWEGAVVERSHLDFYIAKDFSDRSQKPRFVREGITGSSTFHVDLA
ncbi:MAG: hypothetical protein L0I88_06255 [Alkalibacterium sp.]|nr:hypothetical protein [Alkalibacterium sp.]